MMRQTPETLRERYRATLRFTLLGLLLLSPLPFGSVQPWAVLFIEVGAVFLGLLLLLVLREEGPEALPRRARRLLIPAAILVAVGLIQLLPTPALWTRLVASPTADARRQIADVLPDAALTLAPQSLDPASTMDALLRLTAYFLIGAGAAVAFQSPRHLRHVAIVLAISGTFQALYGSVEHLSGHQHIFGYAKKHFTEEATGTFINRNHFAGYLAMTIPFGLGLVLEGVRRLPTTHSRREWLLRASEPAGLMVVLGGTAVAVMWAGVILSYSRGGMACALAGAGFMALATAFRKKHVGILIILLVAPTFLLLWQEVRAPGERFFSGAEGLKTLSGRLPGWEATLPAIPDYLVLGSGLGTFEGVFEQHRPPTMPFAWDHAHNDWLESLVEGGVTTTSVLVYGLLLLLRWPRHMSGGPWAHSPPVAFMSASGAILAVAIHSMVDFGLRIPASAVLLACCVGIACASGDLDYPSGGSSGAVR